MSTISSRFKVMQLSAFNLFHSPYILWYKLGDLLLELRKLHWFIPAKHYGAMREFYLQLPCHINSWNFSYLNEIFLDLCWCSDSRISFVFHSMYTHGICEVIECQLHLQRRSFIAFNEIASSKKLLYFYFYFKQLWITDFCVLSFWEALGYTHDASLGLEAVISSVVFFSYAQNNCTLVKVPETLCTELILFQKSHHRLAVPKGKTFLAACGN